jgi:hypothetical protein
MKKVGGFLFSIGLIALIGPFFGLGLRGTSPGDSGPIIGLIFIGIGLVIYLAGRGDKT